MAIGSMYARAREQVRDVIVPVSGGPAHRNVGRTIGSPYSDVVAPTADPEIGLDKAGALTKIKVMVDSGPPEDPRREAVATLPVRLSTSTDRLHLLTVYRSPQLQRFYDEFRDFVDEAVALPSDLYICSDFNCPSKTIAHLDGKMAEVIYDYDLAQHVSVPTHQRNGQLDLVIIVPDGVHICCPGVKDLGVSDHFLIVDHLRMELSLPTSTTFDSRNIKSIDVFRSKLLFSMVNTSRKHGTTITPTIQ